MSQLDHKMRRTGIGGSEIAGLVGLSNFVTPISIWERFNNPPEELDGPDIRRGNHLEDGMLNWYQQETGLILDKDVKTMRHPKHKIVVATPDAIALDDSKNPLKVVEVKCPRYSFDWGESGTMDFPIKYYPQTIWEMAVTNLDKCDLVALVSGEIRMYPITFDKQYFDELVSIAQDFWDRYIVTNLPPPPDDTEAYAEHLKRTHIHKSQEIIASTSDIDEIALRLYKADETIKKLEGIKRQCQNTITSFIGENAGVEGSNYKITWKKTKDGAKVDWENLAKELGANDEHINKYTVVKPGYRRIYKNFKF